MAKRTAENRLSGKPPREHSSLRLITKRMALEVEMAEERSLHLKATSASLSDYAKTSCEIGTSLEKCFLAAAQLMNGTADAHGTWSRALPPLAKSLQDAQSTDRSLRKFNSDGNQQMAQTALRWQAACSLIEYFEKYQELSQNLTVQLNAGINELRVYKAEGEEAQAAFNKKIEQALAEKKKDNRKSGKAESRKRDDPKLPESIQEGDELILTGERQVFGVALSELMEKQSKDYPLLFVPKICYELVKHIEKYSDYAEGVFRLAGNRKRTQQMIDAIDAGQTVAFSEETDVHVLCSVLKKYLRSMPVPLIPYELFVDFTEIPKYYPEESESVSELKDLVEKLPAQNSTLLAFICAMAKRVSEHEVKNLMGITNLACMLAPNMLYRKPEEAGNLLKDSSTSQRVFELFIKHWEEIFSNVPQQAPPHDSDANILQKVEKVEERKHRDVGSRKRTHDEEEGGRKGLSGKTKTRSGADDRAKPKRRPDDKPKKKPEEVDPESKAKAEQEAKAKAEQEQEAKLKAEQEAKLKAENEERIRAEKARQEQEQELLTAQEREQTHRDLESAKTLKAKAEHELAEAEEYKQRAAKELREAQELRAQLEEKLRQAETSPVTSKQPEPASGMIKVPSGTHIPAITKEPSIKVEKTPSANLKTTTSPRIAATPARLKREQMLRQALSSSSSSEDESLPASAFQSRLHLFLEMENKFSDQHPKTVKKDPSTTEEKPVTALSPASITSPRKAAFTKQVSGDKPTNDKASSAQNAQNTSKRPAGQPPAQVELPTEELKPLNAADFQTTFLQTLETFKQLGTNEAKFPESLALIYKHIYLFEDQFKNAKISTDELYDCVVEHARNWKTKYEFKNNPLMASRINTDRTKEQALQSFDDFHAKAQAYFEGVKSTQSVSELRKNFQKS